MRAKKVLRDREKELAKLKNDILSLRKEQADKSKNGHN